MTRENQALHASSERVKTQSEELRVGQPCFNESENMKHFLLENTRGHTKMTRKNPSMDYQG